MSFLTCSDNVLQQLSNFFFTEKIVESSLITEGTKSFLQFMTNTFDFYIMSIPTKQIWYNIMNMDALISI